MPRHSLDDPDYRRFAWGRYWRVLRGVAVFAVACVVVALASEYWAFGDLPIHLAIATALGAFFTVLLAGALMGLVFLSAGSGHDETIIDPFAEDRP
jgi:hypothetical protein